MENIIFDEIFSIYQIFGYKVSPNISSFKKSEISKIKKISVDIDYSPDKIYNTVTEEKVFFKLNLTLTHNYPHDLPVITLTEVSGLSTDHTLYLIDKLQVLVKTLSGKPMLTDLILCTEKYLYKTCCQKEDHKKLYFNNEEDALCSQNNKDQKLILPVGDKRSLEVLKNVSSEHDILFNNEKAYCFNEMLTCQNRMSLFTRKIGTSVKFQLSPCEFHHCGICHCCGVQCSEYFRAYSFRIWKFPNKEKYSGETSSYHRDSFDLTVVHMCESINEAKELLHPNICEKMRAFISKTINETYFFIGYPISCSSYVTLCKYFDSLTVKLSEKAIHSFIKQILEGISFLHQNMIAHCSIYPCSVLLYYGHHVKLRDEGCVSKVWDFWTKSNSISKELEALLNLHHFKKYADFAKNNQKGDIFNFGLIVMSFYESRIYNDLPIQIPKILNSNFVEFIRCCVTLSEAQRATAEELLMHPYIAIHQPADSIWTGMNTYHHDVDLNSPKMSIIPESKRFDSRLTKEFDLIDGIGRGAYGMVVLARNRVDSCIYAIKRIILGNDTHQEKEKILGEVMFLSRLNHTNIVRYYNAWIEYVHVNWFDKNIFPIPEYETVSENSHVSNQDAISTTGRMKNQSIDSLIVFEDNEENTGSKSKNFATGRPSRKNSDQGTGVYLYIQMEYCERKSLREVIDENGLYFNEDRLWRFFRDVCEGLSYIHSQGMIHRDIKPENILISSLDIAKIVDFNLAVFSMHKPHANADDIGLNNLSNDSFYRQSSSSFNSMCAGTYSYAAPEISYRSSNSKYIPITSKIDMYSFGIVFFEMCHSPFYTKTEKYMVLDALKNHFVIPEIKDETKIRIIKSLINPDFRKRPSADELLETKISSFVLKDVNFEKVLQYILKEPTSSHSKKLLNAFFIHDQKSDIVSCYNSNFYLKTPYDIISYSWDNQCLCNYIKKYFRSIGFLHLQFPTLNRYFKKNLFEKITNLTFLDSKGTRLYFEPYALLSTFKSAHTIPSNDFLVLPILKFGDIVVSHRPDIQQTSEHPNQQLECYLALISFESNINLHLSECIMETIEILDILKVSHWSNHSYSSRVFEAYQEVYDSSELFDMIQIDINHFELLISILEYFKISCTEIDFIINKLAEISILDDPFESSLESFINEKVTIKNKKQLLLTVLSFKGDIKEFNSFFKSAILVGAEKNNKNLTKSLDIINQFVTTLSSFVRDDFKIKICPGYFNQNIWPPDSFIFRVVGLRYNQNHAHQSLSTVTLASGGSFKYNLKHLRFSDFKIKDRRSIKEEDNFFAPTNDPFNINNIKISYSSLNYEKILKASIFAHGKRLCLDSSNNYHHDMILICYLSGEEVEFDYPRLHRISSRFRQSQFKFNVYTYNHPLNIHTINDLREKIRPHNILAIVAFQPPEFTARIFFSDKNTNEETWAKNFNSAIELLNKHVCKIRPAIPIKTITHSISNNPPDSTKEEKSSEITFLFDDCNPSLSTERKLNSNIRYMLFPYTSVLSESCRLVVIISELNDEDFDLVHNQLNLSSYQSEANMISFISKCNHIRVERIAKLIYTSSFMKQPSAFFLYSPLNCKFRSLL